MRSRFAIHLRLAALAFAGFLSGCAGIALEEPLQIQLVDVIPQEMTILEQRMDVVIRIRNPNNVPLTVDGLRFSLDLNRMRLLDAVSNKSVSLPRLGEAVTTVSATTTTFRLIRQALDIDPAKPLDYRISGTIFLKDTLASRVPVLNQGQINLPKLLGPAGKLAPAPR